MVYFMRKRIQVNENLGIWTVMQRKNYAKQNVHTCRLTCARQIGNKNYSHDLIF